MEINCDMYNTLATCVYNVACSTIRLMLIFISPQMPPSRPLATSAGYSKLRQGIRGTRGTYPSIPRQQQQPAAGHAPRPVGPPPTGHSSRNQYQQWSQ